MQGFATCVRKGRQREPNPPTFGNGLTPDFATRIRGRLETKSCHRSRTPFEHMLLDLQTQQRIHRLAFEQGVLQKVAGCPRCQEMLVANPRLRRRQTCKQVHDVHDVHFNAMTIWTHSGACFLSGSKQGMSLARRADWEGFGQAKLFGKVRWPLLQSSPRNPLPQLAVESREHDIFPNGFLPRQSRG
jgi:hypothetical protein